MKDVFVESLVSTMDENVESLSNNMNLENNAIFINQQDQHYYNDFFIGDNHIREYSFEDRGVGLSRNSALMRSDADICIMADDDMIYVDNYLEKIKNEYKKHPDADMIIFNVRIHKDNNTYEVVKKNSKINYLNSLKYGTVSFTFKREKVVKNNIYFSLLFGGGAKFSNGEDSIFLWDCLKSGLKVYSSTEIIADVYNDESSWFTGYNDKFFIDRGALFDALSSKFSLLLIYQYAFRKQKEYSNDLSVKKAIKLMNEGRKLYRGI